mgnify:CR=1 FL=1
MTICTEISQLSAKYIEDCVLNLDQNIAKISFSLILRIWASQHLFSPRWLLAFMDHGVSYCFDWWLCLLVLQLIKSSSNSE